MEENGKTVHTVGHDPVKNTQVKAMPAHGTEFGFMGEDMGVKGRMGDYSSGVNNEE